MRLELLIPLLIVDAACVVVAIGLPLWRKKQTQTDCPPETTLGLNGTCLPIESRNCRVNALTNTCQPETCPPCGASYCNADTLQVINPVNGSCINPSEAQVSNACLPPLKWLQHRCVDVRVAPITVTINDTSTTRLITGTLTHELLQDDDIPITYLWSSGTNSGVLRMTSDTSFTIYPPLYSTMTTVTITGIPAWSPTLVLYATSTPVQLALNEAPPAPDNAPPSPVMNVQGAADLAAQQSWPVETRTGQLVIAACTKECIHNQTIAEKRIILMWQQPERSGITYELIKNDDTEMVIEENYYALDVVPLATAAFYKLTAISADGVRSEPMYMSLYTGDYAASTCSHISYPISETIIVPPTMWRDEDTGACIWDNNNLFKKHEYCATQNKLYDAQLNTCAEPTLTSYPVIECPFPIVPPLPQNCKDGVANSDAVVSCPLTIPLGDTQLSYKQLVFKLNGDTNKADTIWKTKTDHCGPTANSLWGYKADVTCDPQDQACHTLDMDCTHNSCSETGWQPLMKTLDKQLYTTSMTRYPPTDGANNACCGGHGTYNGKPSSGHEYQCTCATGYHPETMCTSSTCDGITCNNKGTCVDGKCVCEPGYFNIKAQDPVLPQKVPGKDGDVFHMYACLGNSQPDVTTCNNNCRGSTENATCNGVCLTCNEGYVYNNPDNGDFSCVPCFPVGAKCGEWDKPNCRHCCTHASLNGYCVYRN